MQHLHGAEEGRYKKGCQHSEEEKEEAYFGAEGETKRRKTVIEIVENEDLMKLVKLPDGQWVRSQDVVLLEPMHISEIGEKGEEVKSSRLRVVVETARSSQEFQFPMPGEEEAFSQAEMLADLINGVVYNI